MFEKSTYSTGPGNGSSVKKLPGDTDILLDSPASSIYSSVIGLMGGNSKTMPFILGFD